MMRRHHSNRWHRWTFWLLPLLLARVLVPVGFMLSWQDGTLSLVICSGTLTSQVSTAATAAHHVEHLHAHDTPDASGTHEHGSDADTQADRSLCPFALAGCALLPDVSLDCCAPALSESALQLASLVFAQSGPDRAEAIRGPPVLV